jgi:hypothetical protein
LEQLQKVYDILLGARNTITLEITLTVAGNYVLSGIQLTLSGYCVCREGYMAYHRISSYQFYTVLWHVVEGSVPYTVHGNQLWDHSSIKKDLCTAWLTKICTELAEGLTMGFKLELSKRVFHKCKLLFIFSRWQKMICSCKCETNSWKQEWVLLKSHPHKLIFTFGEMNFLTWKFPAITLWEFVTRAPFSKKTFEVFLHDP